MKKILINFHLMFSLINVIGWQLNKAKNIDFSTIQINNKIIFTIREQIITKSKVTFKIENLSGEIFILWKALSVRKKENKIGMLLIL